MFFRITQGLHQGCASSPFLFILVIDGLRRGIIYAKAQGLIVRWSITICTNISQLILVDDVLFIRASNISKWRGFHNVLTNFGDVSGLIMNNEK